MLNSAVYLPQSLAPPNNHYLESVPINLTRPSGQWLKED